MTLLCRYGSYKIEVRPSGLMNALSTFQQMMDALLGLLQFVRVYLHDVIIFWEGLLAHIEHNWQMEVLVSKHFLKVEFQ